MQAISTITIPLATQPPSKMANLDRWLQNILWDRTLPGASDDLRPAEASFDVHRLKGRVVLSTGAVKMIQGVRELFEISDANADGAAGAEDASGKIVVIGKYVSGLPWQRSLERALREVPE